MSNKSFEDTRLCILLRKFLLVTLLSAPFYWLPTTPCRNREALLVHNILAEAQCFFCITAALNLLMAKRAAKSEPSLCRHRIWDIIYSPISRYPQLANYHGKGFLLWNFWEWQVENPFCWGASTYVTTMHLSVEVPPLESVIVFSCQSFV